VAPWVVDITGGVQLQRARFAGVMNYVTRAAVGEENDHEIGPDAFLPSFLISGRR